jgi:hypothetical protein
MGLTRRSCEKSTTKHMLESLITSQTRIKLLLKFFLNRSTEGYLRGLANEFGESSNAIRVELNRFEKAELLKSSFSGNKKMYKANASHPLYKEIHSIVMKYIGIDQLIEKVISNLGNLNEAWITDDFAKGKNSKIIDILLVGESINKEYLSNQIEKVEKLITRRIKYIIVQPEEKEYYLKDEPEALLIWSSEKPT